MQARALYEGRWIILMLLFIWAILVGIQPWLALIPAAGVIFTFYFFRDPERPVPSLPNAVVAPADGRVTTVEKMEKIPCGGPGWRISIFLSVFDVHVNRCPMDAQVISSVPVSGKYLDARHPESHLHNESRTWTFAEQHSGKEFVVRQITGAIARRIVPWSEPGNVLAKGERFGMIRFGSRTDLFLPAEAEIKVLPGEKVQGAETVVALWNPGEKSL